MMKRQIYSCWREAVMSLLFCLAPIIFSFSQDYAHCTLEGRWAEGNCFAVSVHGDIVCYATGGLLEIVDYSSPLEPRKRSSFVCNGRIEGITIEGDFAYLVGGFHGFLKILDISDPDAPRLLGSLEVPEAKDIDVKDGFAYISCRNRGFSVVDVSDPENLELTGHTDVEGYLEGVVTGDEPIPDIVFVSTGHEGFAMISVADKENPSVTFSQALEGTCRGIAYDNGMLYIAGTDHGLYIYRLGPIISLASVYDEGGHAEDVVVENGIAYVANRYAGVYILDVSDPESPLSLGEFSTQRANEIYYADEMIYVADTWSFRVIDVSMPADMMLIDEVGMANDLNCFAFHGDYLYTGNQYRGIHVFDLSDPVVFQKVTSFEYSGNHVDLVLDDHYAYIAGGGPGLLILDITFPDVPWLAGYYDFETNMYSVCYRDNIVYCGLSEGGMYAIDVGDPAMPAEIGHFPLEGRISDIQVAGDYAYLSCEDEGLYIVDISNPGVMTETAHLETQQEILQVQLVGDRAYLAEGSAGFSIVDISSTDAPARIGGIDTDAYIQGVFVDGHYAYLAGYSRGLRILDISNPDAIEEIAWYQTGERAENVLVRDGYIYVGDNSDGIYVLAFDSLSVSLKEVAGPVSLDDELIHSIFPNPSNGVVQILLASPSNGNVMVRVIDLNGIVHRIFETEPGQFAQWDGMDQKKQEVPPGIYFLECTAGGKRQVKKVVRQ